MAGTLYHGRVFDKEEYTGNDGHTHYELNPVDGGFDIVSISSIREIVDFCEMLGIPRDRWPIFDTAIDVPLETVHEKNRLIAPQLVALPADQVTDHIWLRKIIAYVRQGETFFYCE